MITILDRYIARAVFTGCIIVMVALLSLMAFLTFINESDNKDLVDSLIKVGLLLPRFAYELFPPVVLVGALMGLGGLAANSELMVMRANGISVARLARSMLYASLGLGLVCFLLGDVVVPAAEKYGRERHSSAEGADILGNQIWFKSGNQIVLLDDVLSDEHIVGVNIFEKTGTNAIELRRVAQAEEAIHTESGWVLNDVIESRLSQENGDVSLHESETQKWNVKLNPEFLSVFVVSPDALSSWGLWRYIRYLNDNDLDSQRYTVALWSKLVVPLSIILMGLLALPVAFGSLRQTGIGQRALLGLAAGASYYFFNKILAHSGQVFKMDPILSAWLPTIVLMGVTYLLLRRVQ